MTRCECFHIEYGRPCCYGTKEVDSCECRGNRMVCDFYPEVRQKATEEWLDTVGYCGGKIDRRELVRRLGRDKRTCPVWVFEVIAGLDVSS